VEVEAELPSTDELPGAKGLHHVGMTVSSMDDALYFWRAFLGVAPRWEAVLDRPYLGRNVGYPGVVIDAAFFDLPGGAILELLHYRNTPRVALPEESGNSGHVHVCLGVTDIDAVFERAVAAGARPVYPDGPQLVDGGPNRGARAAYLRVPPDSASLELFQPANSAPDEGGRE
jgi:catechol 2,3-dioxygenase-like lactoylglutathione lyase family enzyme